MLVIAPTREIAVQIRDVLRNIGRHIQGFQCEAFIGGLSIRADAKKAPKCQVVIGTPGIEFIVLTKKGSLIYLNRAIDPVDDRKDT